MFYPDQSSFRVGNGTQEKSFVDRVAEEQAKLIIEDWKSGVDQYKAFERARHRMHKIRRRYGLKTYQKVSQKIDGKIKKMIAKVYEQVKMGMATVKSG